MLNPITWRDAFRIGFAPQLESDTLQHLRDILQRDDPRLIQGACCIPTGRQLDDVAAQSACILGMTAFPLSGEKPLVCDVMEVFARLIFEADKKLKPFSEQGGRIFVWWFDATPRDQMRRELMEEIDTILLEREHAQPTAVAV